MFIINNINQVVFDYISAIYFMILYNTTGDVSPESLDHAAHSSVPVPTKLSQPP